MSRLSRALKRLGGKPKPTKEETATAQPLQSDPKPSSGAYRKTSPAQPTAQGSPNSASKVTTSTLRKPAPLSGKAWQAAPPCEPVLQSTKAAPLARKLSRPVSTFTEAALPPSSSRKAPAVTPQPQPAPKPTVIAPKAKPRPAPKATRQTPKPTPPKPAVQTHAGLYSGFTPSVATVDQPHPKTLSEAQKAAFDALYESSLSDPGVPKTRRQYMRPQNVAPAALPSSSTMSSRSRYPAGFSTTPYASPSPYSSAGSLGTFRTGGPLGGGQYSSTGGAVGGGAIAQTGGRFGEGSVSKTGGSLGEAMGVQGY
ncbi:MAG: hypothetical protein M1839_001623 [Geoglossum umbratile]|nr:MAG: hypothetical protein M1839_001623 [Geoglossum umbratile]